MKIFIINGPNLNLLGTRETSIYGGESFDSYFKKLQTTFSEADLRNFQSNIEGEIIDAIQKGGKEFDGIILNPGGYTHTSVAIGDAIAAIGVPVIEVHISNIHAREEFRKISHVSAKCIGTITGLGLRGYALALTYLLQTYGR